MNNYYLIFIAALLSVGLMLGGCSERDEYICEMDRVIEQEPESVGDEAALETKEISHSIYVYICGEISYPGVYELEENSRLYELIQRAGGYTEKAAADYLNQAEILEDSQKVYVPSIDELVKTDADSMQLASDGRININTADEKELQQISGIGASRAADIVKYRQDAGSFKSIEEIMQVPGIKDGLFSKIKDQIRV